MPPSDPTHFSTQNIEWQARLQGVALASFKARLGAFLIDLSLIVLLLLLPALASFAGSAWFGTAARGPLELSFGTESMIDIAVALAYFSLATYWGHGASLGKRLMGIRVVSVVHAHLSLWHCFERTLGYGASALELGFGFLQFFIHPNRQTVHDRIAETIVVVSKPGAGKADAARFVYRR